MSLPTDGRLAALVEPLSEPVVGNSLASLRHHGVGITGRVSVGADGQVRDRHHNALQPCAGERPPHWARTGVS
jgi:hypothetical protein